MIMNVVEQDNQIGKDYEREVAEWTSQILRVRNLILREYHFPQGNPRVFPFTIQKDEIDILRSDEPYPRYIAVTSTGEWCSESGWYSDKHPVPDILLRDYVSLSVEDMRNVIQKRGELLDRLEERFSRKLLSFDQQEELFRQIYDHAEQLLQTYIDQNRLPVLASLHSTLEDTLTSMLTPPTE